MTEDWRKIPTERLYEINCFGAVRNLHTKAEKKNVFLGKGKYLGIAIGAARNKIRRYRVHRLVASLFLETPPPEKTQINHIDGDKYNNHVSNLEWCTQEHNIAEGHRLGLFFRGSSSV